MSSREFARQLEYIANHLEKFEMSEQRAIMRRAAIRLRSMNGMPQMNAKIEQLLVDLASAASLPRDGFVATIIVDWFQSHAFLPETNAARQDW